MIRRKLLLALLGAALAIGLATGAGAAVLPASDPQTLSGATLVVSPSKNDTTCPSAVYHNIRGAISDAAPGDTVYVCPGTYYEGTAEDAADDSRLGGCGEHTAILEEREDGEGPSGA